MSEWAQRDLAQYEAQKQNRVAEEALDPGRQAATGQSAELAEDVAPEEATERPAREKAQAGSFDLLAEGDETEAIEAAAGAASGGSGGQSGQSQTTTAERAPAEKESGIEPLARLPEVEGVAARASRGGSAAELRRAEGRQANAGRGAAREIEALLASAHVFEPGRPLAFTARKRRRINDLDDPELDALLDAVREVYPAAPEVVADPGLASWAEEGGVAFEDVGPRGVLGR